MIETAKANGLDPFLYLQSLLQHIPGSNYLKDSTIMDMLMPWHPYMQQTCKQK
ncbi:MAG TPA: transposase domain-containing protein [Clostridiaceae bacterium]|nr:transposase domain-containing protein [Clostridiaceae bacterium]